MAEQLPNRSAIVQRGRLTPDDLERLGSLRHEHTRLGYAYQVAFYRLTGRLPRQGPLEIVPDLVSFVAHQVSGGAPEKRAAAAQASAPSSADADAERAGELLERYAAGQRTVFQHQADIRRRLGLRPFGRAEREALMGHLAGEARHLERADGLVASAEAYLREARVLLPAVSTVRRLVGEIRADAAGEAERRIEQELPASVKRELQALLDVEVEAGRERGLSALQSLKEPPGPTSPNALVAETKKLELIRASGALDVDLSWLRPSLTKALARRVRYSSAYRLRELGPARRYASLLAFLQDAHADTVDHVVDLQAKLVTQAYGRAERSITDAQVKERSSTRRLLRSYRRIGRVVLKAKRAGVRAIEVPELLAAVSEDELQRELGEVDEWVDGKKSDPFAVVVGRFRHLRRYSPSVLTHLDFEADPAGGSAQAEDLIGALAILREMNASGKRRVPEGAPVSFIPKSRMRFVQPDASEKAPLDRAAYEAAVMTALRDEVRRGNVAVKGSKRFGHLSALFMPEEAWSAEREAFFDRAGLPADGAIAKKQIQAELRQAYEEVVALLPRNSHVSIGDEGRWQFSTDPALERTGEAEDALAELARWLGAEMRRVHLPDLLIEVDNALGFTQHLAPPPPAGTKNRPDEQKEQSVQEVCEAVAAVIAYGCNLGPQTMSRLTDGVSYAQIKRVADWHLHEEALRRALAVVVDAISNLETARVWGEGKTSSSDGQRFLFPRRTIRRTYSHRMSDYALEFYSFVADNYAPFYSAPIECTERDAAFVLDGLLYHESDLEIDEHYTDTHGYTEAQFAAFAMLGKRFCPRIRGLSKQRIYRADEDAARYGPLWPMLARRDRMLRVEWIEEEWDRLGRFFCSMATGHTTASVAMKRANAYGGGNHFYRALRELGRAKKTLFVLEYLGRPALRRRVRRGLLKSEELHALARSVFYGKLGKADARDFRRQASTASCLTLILACIVYWQIREIERAVTEAGDGAGLDFDLLQHVSPVQWENVTLYGVYDIRRELVGQSPGTM